MIFEKILENYINNYAWLYSYVEQRENKLSKRR